ncbi:MAG: diguanylate cyclase [Woeseiaceae bacterium]|nr:diguanylate cyclase [Woeseiaceae bacterium]
MSGTTGISVYPHDGPDGPTLLKNADNAMYRAKEQGRDTYTFLFTGDEHPRPRAGSTLENTAAASALAKEEFELHYQPQIDIVERPGSRASRRCCAGGTGPAENGRARPGSCRCSRIPGSLCPSASGVLRAACEPDSSTGTEISGRRPGTGG